VALASPLFFQQKKQKKGIMKFKVDSTSHIGHRHVNSCGPCQDYALHIPREEGSHGSVFAVVSDGCSTGGETDIGSRFVACRLSKEVRVYSDLIPKGDARKILGDSIDDVWKSASEHCLELLGLELQDAYATCISCFANESGVAVHIHGDGVVAFKNKDGSLKIIKVDWNENTPYYPVYGSRFGKGRGVLDSFFGIHALTAKPLVVETIQVASHVQGGGVTTSKNEYTVEEGIKGLFFEIKGPDLDALQAVALFTDGINQISGVETLEAVRECFAFKNCEGVFVKRRLRAALKNWAKDGHIPADDVSCAVIMREEIPIQGKEVAHE
jgi:hypothetical protein